MLNPEGGTSCDWGWMHRLDFSTMIVKGQQLPKTIFCGQRSDQSSIARKKNTAFLVLYSMSFPLPLGLFHKGYDNYRIRNGSRCWNFFWSCLLPGKFSLLFGKCLILVGIREGFFAFFFPSQCSPCWPGTQNVNQAVLELKKIQLPLPLKGCNERGQHTQLGFTVKT